MKRITGASLAALAAMASIGLSAVPAGAAGAPSIEPVSVSKSGTTETIKFNNGSVFRSEPAVAGKGMFAGSFNWTADFQIGFESRTYTAVNSGTHRISTGAVSNTSGSSSANCTGSQVVQITLYREAFPTDQSYGTKNVSCSGGSASWTSVPADTYYFYARVTGNWDDVDTTSRRLSGTTTYP
ncbi:hypothetical protein [Streptomyces sp. SID1121]|uniref:hypothetical protein n=1 Tax=Streptomyces sp. SID1121 TaxID=3425888 RepID=UPI004055B23D